MMACSAQPSACVSLSAWTLSHHGPLPLTQGHSGPATMLGGCSKTRVCEGGGGGGGVQGTAPLHSSVTVSGSRSCTLRSLLANRNSTCAGAVFGTAMARDEASTATGSE